MQLQEKLIRNVVRDEIRAIFPTASKQQLHEIGDKLLQLQVTSRTRATAAIIRCLDGYYGVSETTLKLGTRIYEQVWGNDDD